MQLVCKPALPPTIDKRAYMAAPLSTTLPALLRHKPSSAAPQPCWGHHALLRLQLPPLQPHGNLHTHSFLTVSQNVSAVVKLSVLHSVQFAAYQTCQTKPPSQECPPHCPAVAHSICSSPTAMVGTRGTGMLHTCCCCCCCWYTHEKHKCQEPFPPNGQCGTHTK